jgi:hypothetical protein
MLTGWKTPLQTSPRARPSFPRTGSKTNDNLFQGGRAPAQRAPTKGNVIQLGKARLCSRAGLKRPRDTLGVTCFL